MGGEFMNIAILFAGGVGRRMGSYRSTPKQFIEVGDKPVIIHTLEYFQAHRDIDAIYIACVGEWIGHMEKLVGQWGMTKVRRIVEGGETAQHSIYNALTAAREECGGESIALIHDGVRPFITERLISDVIESVRNFGSAITCTPSYETVIISLDEQNIIDVPPRKNMHSAQAPQAFPLDDIIEAHDEIRKINPQYEDVVDACTIYHLLGRKVHMVAGNRGNIKITRPEDVYMLKGLFEYRRGEEILGITLLETGNEE
jgi:2-C-methyl-D-erythritol 4-phosphate cytidylyltransferase